jgi:hypothetical protein
MKPQQLISGPCLMRPLTFIYFTLLYLVGTYLIDMSLTTLSNNLFH